MAATQKTLNTLKWWYDTKRVTADYIQSLVPAKLTQSEADEIIGV